MGGLTGGGGLPGGDSGIPDIPVADFTESAKQWVKGASDGGLWAKFWSYWASAIFPALSTLMVSILGNLDELMAIGTELLTSAQGMNSPGFFQLTAAMMEDLLGVDVTPDTMQAAFRRGGQIAGMEAVGEKLLGILTTESIVGSTINPDQGIKAAQAFLGYVLSFSVREANVSTIVSMIPEEFRILDGIRSYGVDMARNLGLGRLTRLVFAPFFKALIQDPTTWYFNQKYRPTLLAASEAIRAHIRGEITDAQRQKYLSYAGYPDDIISAMEQEYAVQVFQSGIYNLFKWGQMSASDVVKNYRRRGMLEADANIEYQASLYSEADTELSSLITELIAQRVDGFIDAPTFQGNIDNLPIGPIRKQWILQLAGQKIEVPRTLLSLGEVQAGVESGYLAVDDLTEFLGHKGYSDRDAAVIVIQTMQKIETEAAKEAVAKYKYSLAVAKAKKKGEPIPPPPPGVAPLV